MLLGRRARTLQRMCTARLAGQHQQQLRIVRAQRDAPGPAIEYGTYPQQNAAQMGCRSPYQTFWRAMPSAYAGCALRLIEYRNTETAFGSTLPPPVQ